MYNNQFTNDDMHTLEGQWTFINVHNGFKFFLKEQSHFCTCANAQVDENKNAP